LIFLLFGRARVPLKWLETARRGFLKQLLSIISIFLILEWGELPTYSSDLIKAYPLLWLVGAIALLGFLISAYLVVTSK
jgi:hypothetical protein